ncbi:hypothetical protein HOC13_03320 [Candidatus Woesearchaeota archaeon]|jgi:predicted deacylase|nr:hypothetical protein [Candidatus Woesearchaeota archaeon]
MKYSEVIDLKGYEPGPTIGVVGLCHGDEICGRAILDELKESLVPSKGIVKLMYANLPAEEVGERFVEKNLNRVFPGNPCGELEERIAEGLLGNLSECDLVLDIHSTSYPTTPFVISTVDDNNFYQLASETGLGHYVIMTPDMAKGKSLIDYVNSQNGKGISFEAGTHQDDSSVIVARDVVSNFLAIHGFVDQKYVTSEPQKFIANEVIRVPSEGFRVIPGSVTNFGLLAAGTHYGKDDKKEYSLDYDCYPFLFSDRLTDNVVFLTSTKK